MLFHRDRHQDLLNDRKKVFYSGGDLGDIVAAMPCIRQLGGGDLIIGDSLINGMQPREKMAGKRFEAIKPFLKEIPFIHSVTFGERPAQLDFDFSTFRVNYRHSENLARWQARHVGIQKLDESKWVDVIPHSNPKAESSLPEVRAITIASFRGAESWSDTKIKRCLLDCRKNMTLFNENLELLNIAGLKIYWKWPN